MKKPSPPCILYVSSFPPRECGIATFTQDLTNAIDKEYSPEIKSKICAINDNSTSIYNYPRKVTMQIDENEIETYLNRANDINRNQNIRLVNIQHEYGLFGGEQGEFLIPFMEMIKKPIVITMHTTLAHPDDKMRKVGNIIADKADAITVMNQSAKDLLVEKYGAKRKKIRVIPHGVHHIAFPSKSRSKKKLGLEDRLVLSTFGMISCDKGIEYAIEALPGIVEEFPNVLYLVIGATHPGVLKQEGEKYRNKLKRLVYKHKLEDHVKFYNKYLGINEIIDFLKATDIYVYPMLSKEQASSGSLSYAVSCACPTVATASQYAKSLIKPNMGKLVRFRNSRDITEAVREIILDKNMRKEMVKNSYFMSRHMTWQNVAMSYFNLFNKLAKIVPRDRNKLPDLKLDYIKNLTDNFGMIQFANHTKPDPRSGYCLDDNARAMIGCVLAYARRRIKTTLNLVDLYLDFIKFTQKRNGKFHNFLSYQRTFNDKGESDDSFGRAVWALGVLLGEEKILRAQKEKAWPILKKAIKHVDSLESLRAVAFTIIGLSNLHDTDYFCDECLDIIQRLSDRMVNNYGTQSSADWLWFEDCLTYSNYKLPEALFRSYRITRNKIYRDVAEKSINFLDRITFEKKEFFSPIGQDGWYFRNGKRALFDQQPEDTASAVEALVTAHWATKKKAYKDRAIMAFNWFLGKNHLNQMVYDEATGGCYDGLGKYSLNFNQGAESSLSYFLARLVIETIYDK